MRLALALACLASPLAAQDLPDSAALLTMFTTRCAEIAADPEAALQAAFGSDMGGGAVTSDKALLQHTEALSLTDGVFATLFYHRTILPGGQNSACLLTVNGIGAGGDLPYANLPSVIDTQAEALVGAPVAKLGGPAMQNGEVGQMMLWTGGEGFPAPRSLQLMQGGPIVTIALSTLTPN
jgi:hypothetical protein